MLLGLALVLIVVLVLVITPLSALTTVMFLSTSWVDFFKVPRSWFTTQRKWKLILSILIEFPFGWNRIQLMEVLQFDFTGIVIILKALWALKLLYLKALVLKMSISSHQETRLFWNCVVHKQEFITSERITSASSENLVCERWLFNRKFSTEHINLHMRTSLQYHVPKHINRVSQRRCRIMNDWRWSRSFLVCGVVELSQ